MDRLPSNRLEMTEELIANMLGVPGEGVAAAADMLQAQGLIQPRRDHGARPCEARAARLRMLRRGQARVRAPAAPARPSRGAMDEIVAEWEAFARTLLPAAATMTSLALRDHARPIL